MQRPSGRRPKGDRRAAEQQLLAQVNLSYSRVLELAWLRRLALSSVPVWLDVHWHVLPGVVAWLAFLGQSLCLAMAVAHGVLERRWSRRAAHIDFGSSGVIVEVPWTPWDELRAALWYGLAIVSFFPWAYAGADRLMPPPLLSALSAMGWAVLLLLAAAETLANGQTTSGNGKWRSS